MRDDMFSARATIGAAVRPRESEGRIQFIGVTKSGKDITVLAPALTIEE